jgi:hypothetical protein
MTPVCLNRGKSFNQFVMSMLEVSCNLFSVTGLEKVCAAKLTVISFRLKSIII